MQSSIPASEIESPQRPRRDPSPRVPSDYYAIKRQLGKGHNAVVYLVEYNSDPTPRAMKKILRNNKKTENMNRLRANNPARAAPPLPRTADPTALVDRRGTEEAKIRKEIAIMKKCDHPNIIKFYSFIDDQMSASICLIMEYMAGGELQWASDNEPYLTMDQTRRCMRDVVLGLQYLHHQGIIHRDIKPSNIMWTADRSHVKIGDFGVAHLAGPDAEIGDIEGPRHAGTPAFLAPEIAPGGDAPMGEVTPAVDLWALGVTLFCMLFGRMPFEPHAGVAGHVAAEASLYRTIREDPWTPRSTMCAQRLPVKSADWAAAGVLHLLTNLLRKDPVVRFGINDVKASTDALRWPRAAAVHPQLTANPPQDSAWLLHGVQRREEWIAGTTPRIVVSAADEANAILEPKYKWNLRAVVRGGLGRRFSNLFRIVRDPPSGADGTGAVRSEPSVRIARRSNEKGKGKARADDDEPKDRKVEKKQKQKQKSRSVDAQHTLIAIEGSASKPRRGSDTAPVPLSASTTGSVSATSDTAPTRPRVRGFFRWPGRDSPTQPANASATSRRRSVFRGRTTAARHSTEALGSAPMVGPTATRLQAEQRTRSVTTGGGGRMGMGLGGQEGGEPVEMGMSMRMGLGGDGDGEGMGEAAGMIAVPRAATVASEGVEDEDRGMMYDNDGSGEDSESVCSYGSDARARGDYAQDGDVYDGEEDYDDQDDYDDGPRRDVYDSTSSGDEENVPITFKSARARIVPVPLPQLNGHPDAADDDAHAPPDSEDEAPSRANGPGL
ncbi:kinase-like domain-containing protein [Mycena crocata]|nr:kinase-like domain-containing protein [Mycena crocata]